MREITQARCRWGVRTNPPFSPQYVIVFTVVDEWSGVLAYLATATTTVTLTIAFWLHYSHVLQIAHAPSRGQHSRSHSRSRSRSGSRSYSCSRFDVLVHKNPFTFLINIILGRRIEASSFPGSTRNRSVRVHVPHVA